MNKFIYNKENDLVLINFDSVLSDIEVNCLNELQEYGLIEDYKINLSKRDTKKIIYHHIIHGICEEIRLNKDSYYKSIIIPPTLRSFHEMTQFCKQEDIQIFIGRLLKRLNNALPVVLYQSKSYIFEEDTDPGEMLDLVNVISTLCSNVSDKSFTFEKIKRFTTQFELDFLSKEYFNCIKTKLLLH